VVLPAAQQNVPSSIDLSCCTPPAPDIDEYVRAASGGFVTTTTASWYLPAAQLAHAPELEAPIAAEVLPAGQSVQAPEPVLVLNLPAAQIAQPPSGPAYPAESHLQS
jgi:hypothetical protein